jgi:hypothetical protein
MSHAIRIPGIARPGTRLRIFRRELKLKHSLILLALFISACSYLPRQLQQTDPTAQEAPADVEPAPTATEAAEEQAQETSSGMSIMSTEGVQPEPSGPPVDMDALLKGEPIPFLMPNQEVSISYVTPFNWAVGSIEGDHDRILRALPSSPNQLNMLWEDASPPEPMPAGEGITKIAWIFALNEEQIWAAYTAGRGNGEREIITWKLSGDPAQPWQPGAIEAEEAVARVRFFFLDGNHGWAMIVFDEGGMSKEYIALYRTLDGGAAWEKLLDPRTDNGLQACPKTGMAFQDPDTGWITRECRGLYPETFVDLTADGGKSWSRVDLPAPLQSPDLFSRGMCGIYRPALFPPAELVIQVNCLTQTSPEKAYETYLYSTPVLGASWSIQPYPGGDLYFIDRSTAYAIGRTISRTTDGGQTWEPVKAVNWDGQFAFFDESHAAAVARSEGEIAYVESSDGLETFVIKESSIYPGQNPR